MSHEHSTFKDPKERFLIRISSDWKLIEEAENDENDLYQFRVSEGCVFQIACKEINEHIQKIIDRHEIKPHNYNFPTVSFVEKFEENEHLVSYTWIAVIDNLYFVASYLYDPTIKSADIGLELFDIRFSLRHILTFSKEMKKKMKQLSSKGIGKKNKDYLDIENWKDVPLKFLDFSKTSPIISPIEIDVVKLYALLKCKISDQPNGSYDFFRIGLPLGNMIWWDFVLECDKGVIQIWRTPFMIQGTCDFEGEFDLQSFLESNIKKYSAEIEQTIEQLEKHTIYINHYQSYKECVKTLWKEISSLSLVPPNSPKHHIVVSNSELDSYHKELNEFINNSIKYHALAKSLVLNAAFKVESYLNLIIRIGSRPELKMYPEVLSKFLRQDFSYRIKNLRFYTQIFQEDVDLKSDIYREVKELMTLRNKYVHYEEDTIHNKLGEIFYDRNYPLHPTEENRPAVEATKQTYLKPDLETVRKAYETSNKFVRMVESLILPQLRSRLSFVITQNPIGYNETKGIYSAVYMPNSIDFFMSGKSDDES